MVVAVTPERFWLAAVLFHLAVGRATWKLAGAWRDPARCCARTARWVPALAGSLVSLAVFSYGMSLLATVAANADDLGGLRLGAISGRLMGQALFGEGIVLAGALAVCHWTAAQRPRAGVLCGFGLALLAVYVDAYHIEPKMLLVRWHRIGGPGDGAEGRILRILHITDIQAPVIGEHEERALRTGLDYRPDLIVLTGDYVQDELGRPTEERAKHDLRALMDRIHFDAPLGVLATDGDAGPSCRDTFAGSSVRCLVDQSVIVPLSQGGAVAITGLSRNHGRERDPAWLGRLLKQGPAADHRIVISHAPDFVDAMPEPVDLVLAGHTHGGQVVIPFFGPPRTASRLPRLYAGGLHDYGGIPVHVSRGVGMERAFTPPVRYFCPPEICVLDLRLRDREQP